MLVGQVQLPQPIFLSFHPRKQERVSTRSQSESYSYQRPTMLGICILTKPYHTYGLNTTNRQVAKGCTPFLFTLILYHKPQGLSSVFHNFFEKIFLIY